MSDNTTLNTGAGGDTIRDKDRAGVKTQIVALDLNPSGSEVLQSATALADAMGNPTVPLFGCCVVGWNGTTWDRLKSTTANGLQVDVTRVQGNVAVTGTFWQSTQPVSISGNQAVNVAQVAGATTPTGHGTASGCMRVELPTDGTGIVGAAQNGTWTVQPGNTQNTTPWLVSNYEQSSTIYIDGTAYTVKRAKIGVASSGENTLVSAVSAKKLRVLSVCLIAAGAVNVYFDNATDGAIFGDSTNKITLSGGGDGFVLPHNPYGWFQTGTVNEALRINLSGAVAVSGGLTYIEV